MRIVCRKSHREATDAGKSFSDLRGEVELTEISLADLDRDFGNLLDTVKASPGAVDEFRASLAFLSENAPGILGGLFTAL